MYKDKTNNWFRLMWTLKYRIREHLTWDQKYSQISISRILDSWTLDVSNKTIGPILINLHKMTTRLVELSMSRTNLLVPCQFEISRVDCRYSNVWYIVSALLSFSKKHLREQKIIRHGRLYKDNVCLYKDKTGLYKDNVGHATWTIQHNCLFVLFCIQLKIPLCQLQLSYR